MNLTPLKAIRKRCVNCTGYELKRTRKCEFTDCQLYPYRMGKGKPKLKEIRAYCIWCCNGQRHEVRLCPAVDCPIWEYRFGKRPRKAISTQKNLSTEGVLEDSFEKTACVSF